MTDEICYRLWNRAVDHETIEVCFYNAQWQRIRKDKFKAAEWSNLEGDPISPLEVYHNTNGTMGYEND